MVILLSCPSLRNTSTSSHTLYFIWLIVLEKSCNSKQDLTLAAINSLSGALTTRSIGFSSSRLFTSFISRAMTVEHGRAKSLSALPLSFHSMSCSVGGAKSMETTRSEKSESCSLMDSLLSSLAWSTINLRFLFPLFFNEFAEKKQEKLWRILEFWFSSLCRALFRIII